MQAPTILLFIAYKLGNKNQLQLFESISEAGLKLAKRLMWMLMNVRLCCCLSLSQQQTWKRFLSGTE